MTLFYLLLFCLTCVAAFLVVRRLQVKASYKTMIAITFIGMVSIIYSYLGSIDQITKYYNKQAEQKKVAQILEDMDGKKGLIASLERRLQQTPNSAKGHYLLAKLLASEGLWEKSIKHFRTAVRLAPTDTSYQIHYAQALWQKGQGQFTDEIRSIFLRILSENPNQVDALNMLAMDAYQNKKYKAAINYWRRLLVLAPSGSEDSRLIEEAIQKAQVQLDKNH